MAVDQTTRLMGMNLGTWMRLRERYCRTTWCGAPSRHLDHVQPHADGGGTSYDDGDGLCEACNHAEQAPGGHTRALNTRAGGHKITITTPAGHP